jgi:hypothetical protein
MSRCLIATLWQLMEITWTVTSPNSYLEINRIYEQIIRMYHVGRAQIATKVLPFFTAKGDTNPYCCERQ